MKKHPFADKNSYYIDQQIISSSNIWEYDIKQANINILYSYGVITYNEYIQLCNVPKYVREVYIGKKQQYEKINEKESITQLTIKNGIIEAKNEFLITNKIQPRNIVRIANDAVYVISPYPLQYTKFDINKNNIFVEFVCKNHFSTALKFSNNIIVFFDIIKDDNFNVDVKGISNDILNNGIHREFLSLICEILFYKERTDQSTVIGVFNEYYKKFINLELPINYYREFNSGSAFRLKMKSNLSYIPGPTQLDESFDKSKLDISCNLTLLRELYSAIYK